MPPKKSKPGRMDEFKKAVWEHMVATGNHEMFKIEDFMKFQQSRAVTFTQVISSHPFNLLMIFKVEVDYWIEALHRDFLRDEDEVFFL